MLRERLLRYVPLFHPARLAATARGVPVFIQDLKRYSSMNTDPRFRVAWRDLYPILKDREAGAGTVRGDYFFQDLWAARKIYARRPPRHLDIGSRIDGFVAHVLVFMPVTLVDVRPVESNVEGLTFVQDDATSLARFDDNSVDSLSTLHVAEHFGLGRYGDPVDPTACFRFMQALQRVLSPGGRLYFSVPVGVERVEFNAHRVFSIETVLKAFSNLEPISFSLVSDDGVLHEDIDPRGSKARAVAVSSGIMGNGYDYSCGLFEFTKPG
jgi:SAM-dependent methyltransferase